MNKIDGSYRLLFNNPHLVRDLFRGIINEPWLALLDWSGLKPLPSDYISDTLRQRQSDCVWILPRTDGEPLFILLKLEHQSTNDRMMALRLMTYCGLLYESLLAHKVIPRSKRLLIILPIVLYSGVPRWTASLTMAKLIDPAPPVLEPYILQLRYLLIDEHQIVKHGSLPPDNLASLLFQLEHNKGVAHTQHLMQTVWNKTEGEEYAELRRAFTAWAKYVLLPRALPDVTLPDVDNLLEIKTMLTDHSRSWLHQSQAEGRQEGASTLLQRQLQRKFGTVPPQVEQQLKLATVDQLETWSLNILDASTLDDVFKD